MAFNVCSGISGRLAVPSLLSSVFFVGCGDTGQGPAEPETAAQSAVVIEGASIFDGVNDALIEDAVLVLDGAQIAEIGRRGEVQIPPAATVHDASGKTIIPTLFDLHIHIGIATDERFHSDNYTADNIERAAEEYLSFGVGHVVSMGFDRQAIFEVREAQQAGERSGARVLTAGRGFSPPRGWSAPVPLGNTLESEWMNRPASVEQAREMIQMEAANNVDLIKMWVDDVDDTLEKFTPKMYATIIDEAHQHDLKVVAHIVELEDAKELMRRGVDSLTHIVTSEIDQAFLQLAWENRVVQVVTLVRPSAANDEEAQILMNNVKRMVRAGIPIALGTDSGGPGTSPGLWAHRELELFVEAGMTPQRALRAGTGDAARFLGIDNQAGALEPGKDANFIVLNANPIDDISNTQDIDAVWFQGQEVK